MQHKKLTKYLLDVESVISELELLQDLSSNQFENFEKDILARRAAERLLEIIGEAINQMLKIDPNLKITNSREIIGLRNKIVHAYDSVNASILWGIIVKEIPILKDEIKAMKD